MRKTIEKYFLRAFWFLEMLCALVIFIVDGIELINFNSFEYYSFTQWPWFYEDKIVFVRFSLSLLVICFLSIGYSYRYVRKNMLKALLIGGLPTLIFVCMTLLIKANMNI